MLINKLFKSTLLGCAILATGAVQAQDTTQALLDLLVKKGLVSQQEASDLKAQAMANATAPMAPSAGPSAAPMSSASVPAGAVPPAPTSVAPLSFRIGSANFSPLGFVDFTAVYRGALNGGDIGSSFGSIPYSNTANAQLSETRFSLKNSRLGMRMDSDVAGWKVLGYVEADFLGQTPNNVNQASNSDTLRMRNVFVDMRKGQWEFLAGQDWSMLTPNRKGISPIPGDIFYSQNVDTNYQVGLVWGRTPQVRAVYHATDEWTLGLSAENPDQFVGSAVTLPSNFTASQADTGAALPSTDISTPNTLPDFIAKVAFDTKFGDLPFHADAAGLVSQFRINTFSAASGLNADYTKQGYGGSLNMNISVLPNLQLIENAFVSEGGGRYISTGLGPDFAVSGPDVNGIDHIMPVYAYSDMLGFEWDALPASKIYGYFGQAHYGAAYQQQANGSYVGYGYTGSSNSNNKLVEEYTLGLTQVLWKSPSAGDLKFLTQYSYLDRAPWYVAAGTPAKAHLNMIYMDIRYDLP